MKRHLIFLLVLLHLFTAPLVAQPLTGGTARKAAGILSPRQAKKLAAKAAAEAAKAQ